MKTLQNKPYRGFRKLVDRYIDTAIYLLILAWIVVLTASVAHLGHDLKVLNAEIDELCRVEGINRATAQKVYDYFRKNVDNTR